MKHVQGYAPEVQRGLVKAVDLIMSTGARRATKFISPYFVVAVARPVYRASRRKAGQFTEDKRGLTVVVKIGKPNSAERAFIKTAIAAGASFPVRKVQLRFPSQRKAA